MRGIGDASRSRKERPRKSNASSSSTTQNHPSSSLPLDDTVDENDDESFHSNSSSSPSQNVCSSSNVIPRVIQNPPHESYYLEGRESLAVMVVPSYGARIADGAPLHGSHHGFWRRG
ncbi:hypothetical protein Tco_0967828 [Tanacetum coccineum]